MEQLPNKHVEVKKNNVEHYSQNWKLIYQERWLWVSICHVFFYQGAAMFWAKSTPNHICC